LLEESPKTKKKKNKRRTKKKAKRMTTKEKAIRYEDRHASWRSAGS
jgi:hypothetical protein